MSAARARIGSALVVALAFTATCKVRVGGDGTPETGGDFPCETSDTCPAPDNGCLLATCLDGQCVFVPAPDGVLPEEDQLAGDCKQRFCDGDGTMVEYPAQYDLPENDGNPCTASVCDLDIAKREPKMSGTRCRLEPRVEGVEGVCNGAGRCGVCLPEELRCEGHTVVECTAGGQWNSGTACTVDKPVCTAGACIGIAELATGGEHNCARFDNGTVRCWGNRAAGRLGTNGLASAKTPAWMTAMKTVRGHHEHHCGIRTDGTVWCWGRGALGQLGNGTRDASANPVATGLKAVAIDVGAHHSCAVTATGAVQCWGRNDFGQLGSGAAPAAALTAALSTTGRSASPEPAPISGLTDAAALSLDDNHTCILRDGGQSACWFGPRAPFPPTPPPSADDKDRLEVAPEVLQATIAKPTLVVGITQAVDVKCGSHHCCARDQAGAVNCWGSAAGGALGSASKTNSHKAIPVAGVTDVVALEVGHQFACTLDKGGRVTCWGANDRGQLGRGSSDPTGEPAPVASLGPVRALTVGRGHACALLKSGELMCWGDNRGGQLGQKGVDHANSPQPLRWP